MFVFVKLASLPSSCDRELWWLMCYKAIHSLSGITEYLVRGFGMFHDFEEDLLVPYLFWYLQTC